MKPHLPVQLFEANLFEGKINNRFDAKIEAILNLVETGENCYQVRTQFSFIDCLNRQWKQNENISLILVRVPLCPAKVSIHCRKENSKS
jgi:hypothetical protein